jgi:hypothetical protein
MQIDSSSARQLAGPDPHAAHYRCASAEFACNFASEMAPWALFCQCVVTAAYTWQAAGVVDSSEQPRLVMDLHGHESSDDTGLLHSANPRQCPAEAAPTNFESLFRLDGPTSSSDFTQPHMAYTSCHGLLRCLCLRELVPLPSVYLPGGSALPVEADTGHDSKAATSGARSAMRINPTATLAQNAATCKFFPTFQCMLLNTSMSKDDKQHALVCHELASRGLNSATSDNIVVRNSTERVPFQRYVRTAHAMLGAGRMVQDQCRVLHQHADGLATLKQTSRNIAEHAAGLSIAQQPNQRNSSIIGIAALAAVVLFWVRVMITACNRHCCCTQQ